MKIFIIFIVIVLSLNNLLLNVNGDEFNSKKITQSISNRILYSDENGRGSNIPKLWVFFNSKDININKGLNGKSTFIDKTNGDEITFDHVKSVSGINDQSLNRRLNILLNGNNNNNNNINNYNNNNELFLRNPNIAIQSKHQLLIDETDLPVCKKFIDQILSCSNENKIKIQLVQKSKWLNSISISIRPDCSNEAECNNSEKNINDIKTIINCIIDKPFVDRVDVVSKFKKETVKHDSDEDHSVASSFDHSQSNLNNDKFINSKLLKQENQLTNDYNSNTNTDINNINGDNNKFDRSFYGNTFNQVNQVGIDKLQALGYDGYGVTILMLDSGFYKSHEAFDHLKIVAEHNFIDGSDNTQGEMDDPQNSHGTATLSTIGAYMPGVMIGAAYNASFLLGKTEIVSVESIIEEDYWIAGIEWGEGLGAQIVSSSLGYTQWYNYYDLNASVAHITMMADFATTKGMVVVVSAGNSGNNGIGAPADGKNVIAVGAMVNETGINTSFSSIGPSADGRVKPDIMALGYKNFVASYHGRVNYTLMSGTSFACPLAASGVALLIQARPNWTNKQIYEAVLGSASNSFSPNSRVGFGTFNAYHAFQYKPTTESCFEIGCSGHGGCCNGKCTCSPDYYGEFCQYQKITCSNDCRYRRGKCQFDKFGLSVVCTSPNNSLYSHDDPRDSCSICSGANFDMCGVCGGSNQCLSYNVNKCIVGGNSPNQCKSIVLEENTNATSNKNIKLLVGLSVGSIASVLFIIFSVILIKKKKFNPLLGGRYRHSDQNEQQTILENDFSIDENELIN
ncbi:hypothetical protein RB653_004141 [Dictyostelium firmibasis]|uniref:Peptidase S8/S53 domain-containing protein n=1 Tax=Dictyostelium firmibasis TaxID=79012 RepID=A0AAN7YWR8_9MYCE